MKRLTLVAILMLSANAPILAQQSENLRGPQSVIVIPELKEASGVPPSWGTASTSTLNLGWMEFSPAQTVTTTVSFNNVQGGMLCRVLAAGGPNLEAPIHLPTGAAIHGIDARLCDFDPAARFQSWLSINNWDGSGINVPLVTSTIAEAPGCLTRTFNLSTPIVVNNETSSYSLDVNLAVPTQIAICGARIHYKLQVSPAPATATFADVPVGDAFHGFVEALVSAGITGGCGGGNYCPNAPVTRGQMAVFLAAALGLHWPN